MDTAFSFLASLFQNIFCLLNILLLCQLMFGLERFKKIRFYFLFVGLLAVFYLSIVLLFPEATMVQFLLLCVYLMVWVWIPSKGHHIRAILSLIPATLIYIQWWDILLLIESILGWNKYTITFNDSTQTPVSFISDYLFFGLLLFWFIKASKKQTFIKVSVAEAVFLVFFSLVTPALYYIFTSFEPVLSNSFYSACWSVFVVFLNVAVFYAIIARNYSSHYKQLSDNYRQQFDTEYSYFKEYQQKNADTARFRHDWNNHLILLQQMMDRGEYTQAKNYFQKLTEHAPLNSSNVLTGNEIIDMIFSAKQPLFQENQIKLECEGSLASLSFMESVDLCVLFSNLIDNAIEANNKLKQNRFLNIKTAIEASHLLIQLSNPLPWELQMKDGRILSRKDEPDSHGIGTINVFSVIEKYQGTYEISTENQIFSIKILFPLA